MDFSFKPIVQWPGAPTRSRKRAQFSARYVQTLELLERELRHLGARRIIIQTHHEEYDIRLDGKPRANARVPTSPGVILTFESKHGPLSYPCDTFTRWEDNLRAIALALECLRTVDRYGVTKRGEQYKGWKALPEPSNGVMLPEEAAGFIANHSSFAKADVLHSRSTFEVGYKAAARRLHPDNKETGSEELFKQLQQARAVLEKKYATSST